MKLRRQVSSLMLLAIMVSGQHVLPAQASDICATTISAGFTLDGSGNCVGVLSSSTGIVKTLTIPTGVDTITIEAVGGRGKHTAQGYYSPEPSGGSGARIKASLPVQAGQVFGIATNDRSTVANQMQSGGASATLYNYSASATASESNVYLVAAGGGSAGSSASLTYPNNRGGDGGNAGLVNTPASTGGSSQGGSLGGAGGTNSAGGAGSQGGTTGAFLSGGSGNNSGTPGGGGGQGYYGGGGGGNAPGVRSGGGGGGGASFLGAELTLISESLQNTAAQSSITITLALPPFSASIASFSNTNVGATASSPKVATIRNIGSGDFTFPVGSLSLTGTNSADFNFRNDMCSGQVLTPNSTCTITVDFHPTAAGLRTAFLTFAIDSEVYEIFIQGTGIGVPVFSASSPQFSDTVVGETSNAVGITITNSGSANLSYSAGAVSITGTNSSDYSITSNSCSTSVTVITPLSTCAISVTFSPQALGQRTATLRFVDNASGSPHLLTLSGLGRIAAPNTPSISGVVAASGSATVSVSAAGSGELATSYIVTSTPGGLTCVVTAPATSCLVSGLTNGTAYTFAVSATNAGGTSAASSSSAPSTPQAGVPTLVSVSPISGTISGGTTVTITGTDFVDGATVSIGGVACTPVTFIASTSITCVTAANSAGSTDVVVTNPDALSVTSTGAFTFLTPRQPSSGALTRPASTAAVTKLASTGASVEWLMFTGLAAVISGSGFLAFSRRKRIW